MPDTERAPIRILAFSASLRADSLNRKLANLAARCIEHNGGQVDLASMSEFDAPSYNADLQEMGDWPNGATRFQDRLEQCDAFAIASPEYNASMPGSLKNAVDWVSRFSPQPFNELHGLLMSASPSMAGGNRGLWALSLDHSSSFRRDDPASLVGLTESITAPRVQCGREASPCLGSSLDVTPCRIASGSGAGTHLAMGTQRVGV